jgi:hypothetical protein
MYPNLPSSEDAKPAPASVKAQSGNAASRIWGNLKSESRPSQKRSDLRSALNLTRVGNQLYSLPLGATVKGGRA